jgi:hypothetical protein
LLENSLRYVLKAHGEDVTVFDDATQTQQDRTISSLFEQMRPQLDEVFTKTITADIERVFLDKPGLAAEVTWVASAEVTWRALAEVISAMEAEVTMAMEAEVTMAMAMEDIISVAAFTAMVARITRHTAGRTPAPTEW